MFLSICYFEVFLKLGLIVGFVGVVDYEIVGGVEVLR